MDRQQFLYWELASRDTIDFKKVYVDMADDLISGLLLSQIVYWHLPNKETGESRLRVKNHGYEWIAKARGDWFDEIRITPKQFDRAIKILENRDLVEVRVMKFNGNPTKHIRLKWTHFLAFLEHQSEVNGTKKRVEPYSALDIDQRGITKVTKGEQPSYLPLGNNQLDERSISSITESTNKDYNIDYLSKENRGLTMLAINILGDNECSDDRLKDLITFKKIYKEEVNYNMWRLILIKVKKQLEKKKLTHFSNYVLRVIAQELNDARTSAPMGQNRTKTPIRTENTPKWYKEPEEYYKTLEDDKEKPIDDVAAKKREIEKMLKEIDE
jgi:hypothetical protein